MARQIICDICDVTYTDKRESHDVTVELNGKPFKVYVDVSSVDSPDYYHLDVCVDCRNQALKQLVEK
jgi:hypothetical protein